jgi:hypothetical protein
MSNRTHYDVPAALKDAQQRFEEWRSSHTGRQPIPEMFWGLAAELARHGVFRTAQVLQLGLTTSSSTCVRRFPFLPRRLVLLGHKINILM